MTLYLSDVLNECLFRGFTDFETHGETLLTLFVPDRQFQDNILPAIVEFQGEMISASAMVMEVPETAYLMAVRLCNRLNANTRWYKHFVQETEKGNFQVCVARDWVAKEFPARFCFDQLMDFCHHMYKVETELMTEE